MKRQLSEAIVHINHTANQFESSIVMKVHDKYIDVKSILGLSITLLHDTEFVLEIHGSDAAAAREALAKEFARHSLQVSFIES